MAKHFDGVIFDLDGVITQTALVHAAAWKKAFDQYLRLREKRDDKPFKEFTHENDYLPFVDGKPRYEGVESFLESRGINIAFGDPSDSADKETICGLGNKKNAMFMEALKEQGAKVYQSSVDLIKELLAYGIKIGVASSSKNCKDILESAGIGDLFETRVDGVVSAELGLKGKPEGDIFTTAAHNIGVDPARSVVVEDATSGVEAGRNGGFGFVLGIARENNEAELIKNGADAVVTDLAQIDIKWIEEWFQKKPKNLFDSWDKQENILSDNRVLVNSCYKRSGKSIFFGDKKPVFFLDYDGTITPIVKRPELAVMSQAMRDVVTKLSEKYTVAIVSGRMREDVEKLVGIKDLFYAGSHGFDISGPGLSMIHEQAKKTIPTIVDIIKVLKEKLKHIEGVLVEEKKISVAAHYRLVEQKYVSEIKDIVENIVKNTEGIRLLEGKKVFEILPNIEWDKGKAIRWIIQALKMSWEEVSAVYIGDDTTDEYAFRAIRTRGSGILVSDSCKESAADFQVSTPEEVKTLFENVITSV